MTQNYSSHKKNKSRYIKFACDIETSSEYLITDKPSALHEEKVYKEWLKKVKECKAWIYLYCALSNGRYFLDIEFAPWLDKIIKEAKRRVKTTKLNLFFHNLKYDGSFLLYELWKIGYVFCNSKELKKDKQNCTALIDDNKNIYCIKFWYKNYFFKIQCSYLIARCGIADILSGNNVKPIIIEHLPNTKYEKLEDIPAKTIEYIKQDCYAITLIWKMMRTIKKDSFHVANKLSIGSWGKNAAEIAFMFSSWFKLNKKYLEQHHWDYKKDQKLFNELRKSYHGGLTGLNKSFINNNSITVSGVIKTYDINSAYPFVMSGEIPYMKPVKKPNNKPSLWKIYINDVYRSTTIETIWLYHYFFKENQHIFLIWDFEFELLTQLIEIDYYVIKKYYFGWCPYYAPFINKMNELKEKYSKLLNQEEIAEKKIFYKLLRSTTKLLMNSPYGKEAQKEHVNIKITKNYEWVEEVIDRDKIHFTNIAGASYITAKTRSMILELLLKFPRNILYYDTDCVHVLFNDLDEEYFKESINVDDTKLGSWKFEYQCKYAKYLKKKCYALMNEKKEIVFKTAGYSFSTHNFNWNEFFRGNEIKDISLYSYRNKWNQIILTRINKKL